MTSIELSARKYKCFVALHRHTLAATSFVCFPKLLIVDKDVFCSLRTRYDIHPPQPSSVFSDIHMYIHVT